jgi:natural resistance-associated macrophage protein 2
VTFFIVPFFIFSNPLDPSTRAMAGDLLAHQAEIACPEEGEKCFNWRTFWAFSGPTWLVCCAYIDPGSVQSDLAQGAYTGYQLLWVVFWSTVVGCLFQTLAARVGVVTGMDLARATRHAYRNDSLSRAVWLMMEFAIVGCDIQALIGSAFALNILFDIGFVVGCVVTTVLSFVITVLYFWRGSMVESVVGGLVSALVVCYIIQAGISNPPAGPSVMGWLVPTARSYAMPVAVGTLGGLIMPNVLFLHSSLVLTRAVDRSSHSKVRQANKYFTIENALGMGASMVGNFCIVCVFATGYFNDECAVQGLAMVDGACGPIGLDGVGESLHALWGPTSKYVFAVGLYLSGVASVISSTLSSQCIMEGLVSVKLSFGQRMALTRTLVLIPTLSFALAYGTSDTTLSILNEWINVGMSFTLPFAMVPALHVSDQADLMRAFVNGRRFSGLMWSIVAAIFGINMYLILSFVYMPASAGSLGSFPDKPWFYTLVGAGLAVYLYFCFLLVSPELRHVATTIRSRCLTAPPITPSAGMPSVEPAIPGSHTHSVLTICDRSIHIDSVPVPDKLCDFNHPPPIRQPVAIIDRAVRSEA